MNIYFQRNHQRAFGTYQDIMLAAAKNIRAALPGRRSGTEWEE